MSSSKPKLYYTTRSCGAASFIVAEHGGVDFDCEQVDLKTHQTASGQDFYSINPKGNVPTLIFPNGVRLNEGAAILQWFGDNAKTNQTLVPKWGTIERYQLINILNYVASEVHPAIGGFFNPKWDEAAKTILRERVYQKWDYLTKYELNNGKTFLLGSNFTVADSYLYTLLRSMGYVGLTLDNYPVIKEYYDRVNKLDFVQKSQEKMNSLTKK